MNYNTLNWNYSFTPTINQSAQSSTSGGNGATGNTFTIQSQAGQAATGATHNGGNGAVLSLSSGAGGTSGSATAGTAGVVQLQSAGTTLLTVGGSGLQEASTSISIAAGGTFNLTAVQYMYSYIILTGSLASNVTVVFPATVGGSWTINPTAVTLNGHTITLQANSNNLSTNLSVSSIYFIQYGGTGRLYSSTLVS